MATIGTLSVVLTANSAEFTNHLDKAKKDLHGFSAGGAGKSVLKGLGFNPAEITAFATGFLAAAEAGKILFEVGAKVVEIGAEVTRTLAEWGAQSAENID